MAMVFAEGAVTRLRREFKLLLTPVEAAAVCRRLGRNETPTTTWITSIYFDRPDRPLARRAWSTPGDCLKLRTKEYFPDVGTRVPRVVLEAKRERNGLTQKQREWLSRTALRARAAKNALWQELAPQAPSPLSPVLAVTYVRDVYQRAESWRVTVDRRVRFYEVEERVAFGSRPVTARRLGTPVGEEEKVIVEIKHLGEELPRWLEALGAQSAQRYSKFAQGTSRLYGDQAAEASRR